MSNHTYTPTCETRTEKCECGNPAIFAVVSCGPFWGPEGVDGAGSDQFGIYCSDKRKSVDALSTSERNRTLCDNAVRSPHGMMRVTSPPARANPPCSPPL